MVTDRELLEQIKAKLDRLGELPTLRNVYTVEQFAAEILCGNLSHDWIYDQVKAKKIKAVVRKPILIPMSEAARFITGK